MPDDAKLKADEVIAMLDRKGISKQWRQIDIEAVRLTVFQVLSDQPTFEALALELTGGPPDDDWPKDAWQVFWQAYPRKEASGPGKKALDKIHKSGKTTFAEIIMAVEVYRHKVRNKEPQFVCLPSTWLNGERWKDDPMAGLPNGRGEVKNGFLGRLMD